MWDEPSAEVTQLKKQCEMMLENYEDDIESWYFSNQGLFFIYLLGNEVYDFNFSMNFFIRVLGPTLVYIFHSKNRYFIR